MRVFALSLLLFPTVTPLRAQRLPNPDFLRPPTISDTEASVAMTQAARLVVFQVLQALNAKDETALSSMVPDTLIPEAERSGRLNTGCRTLMEGRARAAQSLGKGFRGFAYLLLNDTTRIETAERDSITITATLRQPSDRPRKVRFTLRREAQALRLVSVAGLLDGVCQSSASSSLAGGGR